MSGGGGNSRQEAAAAAADLIGKRNLRVHGFLDEPDEGFDPGDCSASSSPQEDATLTPLQRVQKSALSNDIFEKPVSRVVQDLFRTAPADQLTRDLPAIMKILTKIGEESSGGRVDLLENVPNIAVQAIENSTRVTILKDVISDYLIPIVVKNLGCSDTTVDKTAQATLIYLVSKGYVSKLQAEIKICPAVLALSKMESHLDVNFGAVKLMSKLAPLLGKDITERIFLKRFSELCESNMFYVRKISASLIGSFCAVIGQDAFKNIVLPCYLKLCTDDIWGVRKSCAEVVMLVSSVCPAELRRDTLAPVFTRLLQDDCRWVRMSAFQTLGPFIATFANPSLTNLGYSQNGEVVLIDGTGCEFVQPAGSDYFPHNASVTADGEVLFKNLWADEMDTEKDSFADLDNAYMAQDSSGAKDFSSENLQKSDLNQTRSAPTIIQIENPTSKEDNFDQKTSIETTVEKEEARSQQKTLLETTTPKEQSTLQQDTVLENPTASEKPIVLQETLIVTSTLREQSICKEETSIETINFPEGALIPISPKETKAAASKRKISTDGNSNDLNAQGDAKQAKNLEDLYSAISLDDSGSEKLEMPEVEPKSQCDTSINTNVKSLSTENNKKCDSNENKEETIVNSNKYSCVFSNKENETNKVAHELIAQDSLETIVTVGEATKEPKTVPLQGVVPQDLVGFFVSMTEPMVALNIDSDMAYHCAYSLPAVVLTLGKENWPILKKTVDLLASDMQYKVRRTIASSLHELATILGSRVASEDLTPLFDGFLKDLDEVRIGILTNLSQFLGIIDTDKRYYLLPKLGEFLRVDNVCNWRFRETLAQQLELSVRLFKPADVVKHIGLYAQALMLDKVSAVKQAALFLIAEVIKTISVEHGLASSYLAVIAERFAHSKKWKPRQTFAMLCSLLLQHKAIPLDEFSDEVLPHLLDLSWDPVSNVRLVVAQCLANDILELEYFMVDPENEHQQALENVLRRLQADKDAEVRNTVDMYTTYTFGICKKDGPNV